MAELPSGEVTRLLSAWRQGDPVAPDRLMSLVYGELRKMARRLAAGQKPGHTFQTTALIHDVYLRLVGHPAKDWQSRSHFLAVCAQAMRHILVDYARARQAAKRGGGDPRLSPDRATVDRATELIALDEALAKLKVLHLRQCRVVECRYFGGLSVDETAEALQVSPETVMRDWKMAKAFLHRALTDGVSG